jgi:hypothetical protein
VYCTVLCCICAGFIIGTYAVKLRAVESESEGILGGVGRNFMWSRSRRNFRESEGILGGVGVGRNFRWSRSRKEF